MPTHTSALFLARQGGPEGGLAEPRCRVAWRRLRDRTARYCAAMRERIISEIKRLAEANGGKPPGLRTFEAETGIRVPEWHGIHWARWGDALSEAGYVPNELQPKSDKETLLRQLADAYRAVGRVATKAELRMYHRSHPGLPSYNTYTNHFGSKAALLQALRGWAIRSGEYPDVVAMLPADGMNKAEHTAPRKDGSVYLIQYGPHYKIGRGSDLERRVKQVQIALPETGTLVHAITTDDPPGIEAYWHRRFAAKRVNGEWFKLAPADVLAFKRRRFQ